mmetsp:Transcript_11435/g.11079  ORF Transcript_11435/g.11079 Transcript_11435/m.11079 type:complete len:466 (-) Transcript_11435:73-1470(-)
MSNTEENTINISDMLLSMAECVIETPQNFTIPKIPDIKKPTSCFQPKKPPKEIFYSKNLLYLEENVLEEKEIKCHCSMKCTMDKAYYKCLSCALFDIDGNGYFCEKCFNHTHPWHRSIHIFIKLASDECLDYRLNIVNDNIKKERIKDSENSTLNIIHNNRKQLDNLNNNDAMIDRNMSMYGGRIMELERYIQKLRDGLNLDIKNTQTDDMVVLRRKSILSGNNCDNENNNNSYDNNDSNNYKQYNDSNYDYNDDGHNNGHNNGYNISSHDNYERNPNTQIVKYPTPDISALIIQKLYRGFIMRKILSTYYLEITVRVWDAMSGRDYYYNKTNHTSSWEKPYMIHRGDCDKMEYREDIQTKKIYWCLKNDCSRRRKKRDISTTIAITIINSFLRCILARNIILLIAKNSYRRIYDNDYDSYFYWNLNTNTSVWEKPKIFMSDEPPLHIDEKKIKKIKFSPKINRL